MRGITKRFPGIIANQDIHLAVKKGEIHALLGENGAGKSTLMNILFGLYQPDEGEIYIKGKSVNMNGPGMANNLGIGMVHQHFMLIQSFTVTENIILGDEPTNNGMVDYGKAEQEIRRLSDYYGLKVDPNAKVADISVGMQQRVEILKTLYRGADTLIFDEPTAVLTPQEIEELIQIMRNLVQEDKTIIFITHKLEEIMTLCDRVTVVRNGKVIRDLDVHETNESELASLMVGREVTFTLDKETSTPKEVVLRIKDLVVKDYRGMNAISGLNLEVRAGEIVGLAGVDGNGQSELIEAIAGLRGIKSGNIHLKDNQITNKRPRKITRLGVGHIPEDRHKRGLVLDFTVEENAVLQSYYEDPFSNGWLLNHDAIGKYAQKLIDEFDIRTPDKETCVRTLSGGNQQKIIIAREVDRNPDFLIAAQPTRGLDVGAIEFIHRRLVEQRNKGKGVLLVSLELDELFKLSDRLAVIHKGKIIGCVDPKEVTDEELGLLMAGITDAKE